MLSSNHSEGSPLKNGKTTTLETFGRALLAGTCLAAVGGVASAATITEGTLPAPSDFPNTGNGYIVPLGTTDVIGQLTPSGFSDNDWFEFEGLLPGSPFVLDYTFDGIEHGIDVLTDGGSL